MTIQELREALKAWVESEERKTKIERFIEQPGQRVRCRRHTLGAHPISSWNFQPTVVVAATNNGEARGICLRIEHRVTGPAPAEQEEAKPRGGDFYLDADELSLLVRVLPTLDDAAKTPVLDSAVQDTVHFETRCGLGFFVAARMEAGKTGKKWVRRVEVRVSGEPFSILENDKLTEVASALSAAATALKELTPPDAAAVDAPAGGGPE